MNLGMRVVFRMQERDAARFLNHDNTLAADFDAPGVAVVNGANGRLDGNVVCYSYELGPEFIQETVAWATRRYPDVPGRFVVNGDSFALFQVSELPRLRSQTGIGFDFGVPMKIGATSNRIEVSLECPERLAITGYNESKWHAIFRTWCAQLKAQCGSAKIVVIDFSKTLKEKIADWGVDVLDEDASIAAFLADSLERLQNTQESSVEEPHFICFYDLGAARLFRRKLFDFNSRTESDHPAKSAAADLIRFGPSARLGIVVFCRRAAQVADVFRAEYDTPVRLDQFEYQISVDPDDPDYNKPTSIGPFAAYLMDKMSATDTQIVLFNGVSRAI
jgi:hypothetical protein